MTTVISMCVKINYVPIIFIRASEAEFDSYHVTTFLIQTTE